MRILHVTSDWKWTGPAEPMLRLALALRERGHAVGLACPDGPADASRSLAAEARGAGLAPHPTLARARSTDPFGSRRDVGRLRAVLESDAVEVVHCWHTRDHLLALRAARARRRAGRTALVRSQRRAEAVPARPWNRWLFGPGTDGLLCVSPGSAERQRLVRGERPLVGAFGAVDAQRFRPAPAEPSVRHALGLEPGAEVVGIVARVQRHRRFDLLLAAAARLLARRPTARLLVIGRGTHRAEIAERPAARLGIADRVCFAGYRGADYVEALRCIDVFTFLVPGSDGSCRAVLEAAACGLPAVTSRRGALPEIVVQGETGLLVDEDPAALAAAWEALLADPVRRAALGAAARRRAQTCFAPGRLADAVEGLYARVAPASRA